MSLCGRHHGGSGSGSSLRLRNDLAAQTRFIEEPRPFRSGRRACRAPCAPGTAIQVVPTGAGVRSLRPARAAESRFLRSEGRKSERRPALLPKATGAALGALAKPLSRGQEQERETSPGTLSGSCPRTGPSASERGTGARETLTLREHCELFLHPRPSSHAATAGRGRAAALGMSTGRGPPTIQACAWEYPRQRSSHRPGLRLGVPPTLASV